MPQARLAKIGFAAALLALSFSSLGRAATERLAEQPARGLKGLHISGFRGNLVFIPSTDTKITVEGRASAEEALQSPWKPAVAVVDGWLQVTVNGPSSKADYHAGRIPALDLEVRGPAIPLQVVWKEGDISLRGWKAPAQITDHNGKVFVEEGRDTLKVNSLEGEVIVQRHQGRVEVDNYNARVVLNQVEGPLALENFSGHLTVEKSKGDISLKASKGKSEIKDHKGRFEFDLAQGEISVTGLEGAIRGSADQGSITAGIKGVADLKVRTEAARVAVLVSKSSGARVDLGTQDGAFSVGFPLKYDHVEKLKLMKGTLAGREPGLIFVRSQSGDIRLKALK